MDYKNTTPSQDVSLNYNNMPDEKPKFKIKNLFLIMLGIVTVSFIVGLFFVDSGKKETDIKDLTNIEFTLGEGVTKHESECPITSITPGRYVVGEDAKYQDYTLKILGNGTNAFVRVKLNIAFGTYVPSATFTVTCSPDWYLSDDGYYYQLKTSGDNNSGIKKIVTTQNQIFSIKMLANESLSLDYSRAYANVSGKFIIKVEVIPSTYFINTYDEEYNFSAEEISTLVNNIENNDNPVTKFLDHDNSVLLSSDLLTGEISVPDQPTNLSIEKDLKTLYFQGWIKNSNPKDIFYPGEKVQVGGYDIYTPYYDEDDTSTLVYLYSDPDKCYAITSGTSLTGEVTIPAMIQGYPVRTIGASAFMNNTSITKVNFPETLYIIGEKAFVNCTGLTSVTISDKVTEVGKQAFAQCSNITSVNIGKGVTNFGDGVFGMNTKLETAIFNCNSEALSKQMFYGCSLLKNVTLPKNLKTISSVSFYKCTSLETINVPSSVTSIEEYAFTYCEKLKEFTVPTGVTEISSNAFRDCTLITKIVLPEGIRILGKAAFYSCENLCNITIPSTVTEIRDMCFDDCFALKSFTLPEGLLWIGDFAFNHCSGITQTSITIPSTVMQIGGNVYVGNNNTNDILGAHVFYDCGVAYVREFRVASGNQNFVVDNGVLYTKDYKYLVSYPTAKTDTSYTIKDGCVSIFEMAIGRSINLTTLSLPNSFVVKKGTEVPSNYLNNMNTLNCGIYLYNSITAFSVRADNPNYSVIDGVLYNKDGTQLIAVPTKKAYNDTLTFASSCTTMEYAFLYTKNVLQYGDATVGGAPTKIVIGINITTISDDVLEKLNILGITLEVEAGNTHYRVNGSGLLESTTE